jgi:hypothetical protein
MRKFIPQSLFIIFSGIILLLISCTSGSCFDETNSFLKASFYSYSSKKTQAPDSLSLYSINLDTNKVYRKSLDVKVALIPLDGATDSCVFIIKINKVTDTLSFWYSSYPHLISTECGYTLYHNLDSLAFTKNGIDSIFRTKNSITTINEENIRIFY